MTPFLQQHWEVLTAVATLAVPALISTAPKPGTWQGWGTLYAWIYSFAQEMISMRSAKMSAGAEPQIRTSVAQSTIPEDKPKENS